MPMALVEQLKAELQPVGLVRHGMAGGTSPRIEHCLSVGKIGLARRQRSRRNGCRNGKPPEYAEADQRDQHQAKDNTFEHSPTRHPESSRHQYERICRHKLAANFAERARFRE